MQEKNFDSQSQVVENQMQIFSYEKQHRNRAIDPTGFSQLEQVVDSNKDNSRNPRIIKRHDSSSQQPPSNKQLQLNIGSEDQKKALKLNFF